MANERYSRQIKLQGFGEAAQQKLSGAKVLVIGAGGLGCPALQYLSGAGTGCIGIVDGDTVALSNLHRQPLYRTTDIGALKVRIAAERLALLNNEIVINEHAFFINAANCLLTIKNYDVVIDCSDNFETRYLVNDACALFGKPLIFAAVNGYEGQLAIFDRDKATGLRTNYRDLFPVQPLANEILNCEENGVIGVLPGIMGTMQAAEAIKLITGTGVPLVNRLLNYDMLNQLFYEVQLTPASRGSYTLPADSSELEAMHKPGQQVDHCSLVTEIGIDEMQQLINGHSTLIIDVRETFERPKITRVPSKAIPMSVFKEEVIHPILEKNIILICQHGVRSMAAGRMVKDKFGTGKNVYSLKGGVARWGSML